MNTREVADKLDTDPKRLRRFLRSDVTYRNAGQGGRYDFTEKDMATLRKRFDAWNSTKTETREVKPPRRSRSREVPAMSVEVATKRRLTTAERERRDELSRQRVERLEARLMATGLHISQIRDRSRS